MIRNMAHESGGLDIVQDNGWAVWRFLSGGQKAIEINTLAEGIEIDLILEFKYGQPIHELSEKMRQKIKLGVESMTGLSIAKVNIRVSKINPVNNSPKEKPGARINHSKETSKRSDMADQNQYRDIDQVEQ